MNECHQPHQIFNRRGVDDWSNFDGFRKAEVAMRVSTIEEREVENVLTFKQWVIDLI